MKKHFMLRVSEKVLHIVSYQVIVVSDSKYETTYCSLFYFCLAIAS